MARIALVNCDIPNGLRLTLERREEAGLTGIQHVELEPGLNHVDPDFWEAWIAENLDYSATTAGAITGSVVDLDDEPEPAPEPAPAPELEPANEAEVEETTLPAPAAVMSGDSNMHLEGEDHVAVQPEGHAEPLPVATPESELPLDETQHTSAPSVQAEDAAAYEGTPLASAADMDADVLEDEKLAGMAPADATRPLTAAQLAAEGIDIPPAAPAVEDEH